MTDLLYPLYGINLRFFFIKVYISSELLLIISKKKSEKILISTIESYKLGNIFGVLINKLEKFDLLLLLIKTF